MLAGLGALMIGFCCCEFVCLYLTEKSRNYGDEGTLDVKHYLFHSDEQTCVTTISHDEEHDTLMTGDNECEGNNYNEQRHH